MRRALAIDEASFGPEHPNVARDLNNLARLLQDTDRAADAEPRMRRAFVVVAQALGREHPTAKMVRGNYAELVRAQGGDVEHALQRLAAELARC
jgi:hypothetical protein